MIGERAPAAAVATDATTDPAGRRRGSPPERWFAHDFRLVPAAAGAWLAAMAAPSMPPGLAAVLAAVVFACAATLLLAPRSRRRRHAACASAAAALACTAAGLLAGGTTVAASASGPLPELAREQASVALEVVVTADPRTARPSTGVGRPPRRTYVVEVRAESVTARGTTTRVRNPVVVLADDERWADLLPGTRLRATGRLAEARDDAAAVLRARGRPDLVGAADAVQRSAGQLRAGLRTAVAGLPPDERGLVPGLVVGDTSELPPELEEDFRTAGMTHLVAVSGANVAIVCGAVLVALRWVGVGTRAASGAAALALAWFVVLARPQPSVLRAGVMGAIALVALALGRRAAAVPALAAAVLGLVLIDPTLARSYGFALSVLATAGIVLLARPWTHALRQRGVPLPLGAALAVPAAAQLTCAPVVAMLSGQLSLVAIPANLLVAPAVAPTTLLGVLAAATAPASPTLAALFARLAAAPAAWIVWVAKHSAQLPHASVPWPDGLPGAAAMTVTSLATVVGVRLVARLWSRRRSLVVALAAAALVAGGLRVAAAPTWPPTGWLLVACDVGQGDALVLRVDESTAVVVDAGPEPRAVDGCLRRLGVHRVSLLVLTHLHADHVGGVSGVLHGRQVAEAQVGPLDEPSEQASRVARDLAAAQVPVSRIEPGERRVAGPLGWRVLWPRRVIRGDGESVPNNSSIVLLVEVAGVRMLLAGDIELSAQRAIHSMLATEEPGAAAVDILKVAHHGSAVQSPELITALRPGVALVTVGAGNSYGHPAQATLSLLASLGAVTRRTDIDGDIAVVGPRERLHVVSRGR